MTIDIVRYEVQVGPQDIDVLNHVNNRVYLRWVEEAATITLNPCVDLNSVI